MYVRGSRGLGSWEDVLTSVLTTGEKIVQDVKKPPTVYYPGTNIPMPTISSVAYPGTLASSPLTTPLLIAGGAVLIAMMMRRSRR